MADLSQDRVVSNNQKLYNNLLKSGKITQDEIGDFNTFNTLLSDSSNASKLRDNLISKKNFSEAELGSHDDFLQNLDPLEGTTNKLDQTRPQLTPGQYSEFQDGFERAKTNPITPSQTDLWLKENSINPIIQSLPFVRGIYKGVKDMAGVAATFAEEEILKPIRDIGSISSGKNIDTRDYGFSNTSASPEMIAESKRLNIPLSDSRFKSQWEKAEQQQGTSLDEYRPAISENTKNIRDWQAKVPTTSGAADFVGQLIPQVATLIPVILSRNPTIGKLYIGQMAATSYGTALQSYDDYIKESGEKYNSEDRTATAFGYAAAEYFAEKIGLDYFMPKGYGKVISKSLLSNPKVATKIGKEVLETYARATKQSIGQILKKITAGSLIEGGEEGLTELMQIASDKYLTHKDVSKDEVTDRLIQSVAGGALMGKIITPFSMSAQKVSDKNRRREQGTVTVSISEDGTPLELIKDKNNIIGLTPNGEIINEISEETINKAATFTTNQFESGLAEFRKNGDQISKEWEESILQKNNEKISNAANIGAVSFKNIAARTAAKKEFEQASASFNDIPNANYTEAVTNLLSTYTDPKEIITNFNKISSEIGVEGKEYETALNFLSSSVKVNSLNKAKQAEIEKGINDFKDDNGNITSAEIEGEKYYIKNSADLGQSGRIIFAKNQKGEVKPFNASLVKSWETLTPDQITQTAQQKEAEEDNQFNISQKVSTAASQIGIEPNKSVKTPNGIAKIVSVNNDGTVTVVNQKGLQDEFSIDEVEAYKTEEQKKAEAEAEKQQIEAEKAATEKRRLDELNNRIIYDKIPSIEDGEFRIIGDPNKIVYRINENTGKLQRLDEESGLWTKEGTFGKIELETAKRAGFEKLKENINAKYDAELAAVQQKAKLQQQTEARPQEQITEAPQYPVLKDGNPDYEAMDPEVYFNEYAKEFSEEEAKTEIQDMQRAIIEDIKKKTAKKSKSTSANERAAIAREIKSLNTRLDNINGVLQKDRSKTDLGSDTKWVAKNSSNPDEIISAYEQEKSNAPVHNLKEWQKFIIGVKFNPDSFSRFGDKNNVTSTLAKTWLNSDGHDIDQFIRDNFEDVPGFENVTEQDVINFITENPTGQLRKTTDTQNELRKRYREITGVSIDNHKFDNETLPTQAKLESFLIENKLNDNWFTTEDLQSLVTENKDKLNENDYNEFTDYLSRELTTKQSELDEWDFDNAEPSIQTETSASEDSDSKELSSTKESEPIEFSQSSLLNEATPEVKSTEGDASNADVINIDEQLAKLDNKRQELLLEVEPLVELKKKLYSNVDIESPKSEDEKKLEKQIANIFSDIQSIILEKRKIIKQQNENVSQRLSEIPTNTGDEIQANENLLQKNETLGKESTKKSTKTAFLNITEKAALDLKEKRNAFNALNQISKEHNQSVEVINSTEIPEWIQSEERSRIAKGKKAVGFYNPRDGKVYIISDRIRSVSEVKKTYLHEIVAHKGLRGLFQDGKATVLGRQYEKFNDLMDEIFNSMAKRDIDKIAKSYIREYKGKEYLSTSEQRLIADEFLAHIAETEVVPTKFQNIIDRLVHLVRKTFGFTSGQFTQSDLLNIIKEQRSRMADGQKTEEKKDGEVRMRIQEMPDKNLIALHNISESQIINADKTGGLITPSLAIVKKGEKYTDFGDITLVGNRELIDPEKSSVKVFKGDVYSPTVPRPEFYRNEKPYKTWVRGIMSKAYDGDYRPMANIIQNVIDDFGSFGKSIKRYNAEIIKKDEYESMKPVYLLEKQIPFKVPMVSVPLYLGNNMKVELSPSQLSEAKYFSKKYNEETKESSLNLTQETKSEYLDFIRRLIISQMENDYAGTSRDDAWFNKIADGILNNYNLNYFNDRLSGRINNKKELDKKGLKASIDKAFKKISKPDYDNWLNEKINSFQGASYFEKGNQKLPYTVDNLIDATTGHTRAKEKGLTYGMNRAKASAISQLKNIDQIRKAQKDLVSKEEMTAIEKDMQEEYFKVANSIVYKYGDQWGKLDDFGKSLADYFKGNSPLSALSRNNFKPSKSDLDNFKEFADKLKNSPIDYLEAKTQRLVGLDEFSHAVIPATTDKETIAILKKNGIKVAKYTNNDDRADVLNNVIENNPQVRFRLSDKLPETISIDGVERPTTNSKGQPIADTEEKIRNFYNWFQNSKVVDEEGRPLVVYHGTAQNFDTFSPSKNHFGIHFGSEQQALNRIKGSGKLIESYINLKNPLYINDLGLWRPEELINEIEKITKIIFDNDTKKLAKEPLPNKEKSYELIEIELENYGHDGLIYNNKTEGLGESYVVFSPTQIKSATDNIGTFDGSNPDIRFRVATSQQELDDFVKDSKIKETVYHGTVYQFEKFEPGKKGAMLAGIYFSPYKYVADNFAGKTDKGRVIACKINIQNPYIAKSYVDIGTMSFQKVAQLKEQGYDGAYFKPTNEQIEKGYLKPYNEEWVVFSSDQVLIDSTSDDIRSRIEQERSNINTDPSQQQKEAGNYKKGHIKFDGFDISIENPKGSTRSGVDQDGESWKTVLPVDYGYFRGTVGKDKDHIDVFIGSKPEIDKVYVVDQINPKTGNFDEHKVMLGFNGVTEARKAYQSSYPKGWEGLNNITRTTKEGLKDWFENGNTKKPFADSDIRFRMAYHGSPHQFDKFTTEKIGAGEGNQAFGWGLYFTDKKSIAEDYANKLQPNRMLIDGKTFDQIQKEIGNTPAMSWVEIWHNDGMTKSQIINKLNEELKDKERLASFPWIEPSVKKTLDYLKNKEITKDANNRNVYSVELHQGKEPGEYDYLRWDKNIPKEQVDKINTQAEKEGINVSGVANTNYTGEWAYKELQKQFRGLDGTQEAASKFLLRAGIDGIQYPTEVTSKGSHEESFNYVIFDENAVEVKEHVRFRQADKPIQSEIGFYSPTEKALNAIEQEKGTAGQFEAMLIKNGAKQAELDWMGWKQQFPSVNQKVTKEDVQNWIDQNKIEVQEVVKGDLKPSIDPNIKEWEDWAKNKYPDAKNIEVKQKVFSATQFGYDVFVDGKMVINGGAQSINYMLPPLSDTKFSQYVEPGGSNYKELLLTMPTETSANIQRRKELAAIDRERPLTESEQKEYDSLNAKTKGDQSTFKSSHFDEPNILAHVRFNEREVNGEKVLFIEEIQSDWAQKGKKEGFGIKKKQKTNAQINLDNYTESLNEKYGNEWDSETITEEDYSELTRLNDLANESANFDMDKTTGVPSMPFSKTDQWVNLALRRMMRYAAENGFNRIAWANGEQQAARYDLSKQVERIVIDEENGQYTVMAVPKGKQELENITTATKENLADYVGKEIASKAIEDGGGDFRGNDLKVGGSGMKAFYDAIVPSAASKLGKPFGARVENIHIDVKPYITDEGIDLESGEVGATPDDKYATVQSIPVTDKMIESVSQGVPLFRQSDITKDLSSIEQLSDIAFKVSQKSANTVPKNQNEDTEKAMNKAHGLKGETILSKIDRWKQEIKETTQHFKYVTEKEFPQIYNDLRLFESIPEVVKKDAYDRIADIVRPIANDKNLYKAFERYVVISDLMHDIKSGIYTNTVGIKEAAELKGVSEKEIKDLIESGEIKTMPHEKGQRYQLYYDSVLPGAPKSDIYKQLPFSMKSVDEVETYYNELREYINNNPSLRKVIANRNSIIYKVRDQLIENGLMSEKTRDNTSYFHHMVMKYRKNPEKSTAINQNYDVRVHPRGWQKSRTGSMEDYNTDYLQSEFEVIAQSLEQLAVKKSLQKIGQTVDIMPSLVAQANNEGGSWRDFIPEGYTTWHPRPGTNAWAAASMAEKAIQSVIEGNPLTESLNEQLAEADQTLWVIPTAIANQLDEMKTPTKEMLPVRGMRFFNSTWKQWILLNPARLSKYMINNFSGDLDIVFAYNPKILQPKYAWTAAKELYNEATGKGMSKDMREAIENAVISSGLSIQEIPDVNKEGVFKTLTGDNNLFKKYWNTATSLNDFREGMLRLAAYKFFKEELNAGKTHHGVSNPKAVDSLRNNEEKAGKMARELLGDYGNLSQGGIWLRSHAYPFWSWMEINAPRYYKLLRNTYQDTNSVSKTTGAAIRKTAISSTALAARIMLLSALVTAWNRLFFPDEDDELTKTGNRQLRLITGRRDDGSIVTLRIQGAFSDVLSFVGLEDAYQDVRDIKTGKTTVEKKAKEAGSAFINRVGQGAMPFERLTGELITGKSVYPDILHPRPIIDRAEHAFRMVSLDKVYRFMTKKPLKKGGKELIGLVLYETDPGEAAYYAMRQRIYDFLDEKEYERPSGDPTEKSIALRYYKQAKKFKDTKLENHWLAKYKSLGGTIQGMKTSIKKGEVTNALPREYKKEFLNKLDGEDREVLEMAERWYDETYKK